MSSEPEKPKRKSLVLPLIGIIVLLCGGLYLLSLFRSDGGGRGCSLSAYRAEAQPLMTRLSNIIDDTSISNASSRASAETAVTGLLRNIDELECKNAYPLKHETLEFAAQHFLDALEAVDDGRTIEADQAMSAAILNAERFNNWSVDVDN